VAGPSRFTRRWLLAGVTLLVLAGVLFLSCRLVNPTSPPRVDNAGSGGPLSPRERQLDELLARADEAKFLGHKHLVEGDYDGAIESYEGAFDLYEQVTSLAPRELYEQKKKQVAEWLMDVRDREFIAERRALLYGKDTPPPQDEGISEDGASSSPASR